MKTGEIWFLSWIGQALVSILVGAAVHTYLKESRGHGLKDEDISFGTGAAFFWPLMIAAMAIWGLCLGLKWIAERPFVLLGQVSRARRLRKQAEEEHKAYVLAHTPEQLADKMLHGEWD